METHTKRLRILSQNQNIEPFSHHLWAQIFRTNTVSFAGCLLRFDSGGEKRILTFKRNRLMATQSFPVCIGREWHRTKATKCQTRTRRNRQKYLQFKFPYFGLSQRIIFRKVCYTLFTPCPLNIQNYRWFAARAQKYQRASIAKWNTYTNRNGK